MRVDDGEILNKKHTNMQRINKKQYEKLLPYKKNLVNAYRNSFVHVDGTTFQKIAALYEEIIGTPLTKNQMGCNTCRLNALKKLGELFTKYEEDAKKKEKKEKQEEEATTKKKGGRQKILDKEVDE